MQSTGRCTRNSNSIFREIAPVAGIARAPQVMDQSSEFIAYAKANPGKLNFASGGIGAPAHVTGELFKMMAGVNMVHVPYRGGGPALTDLIGGQVQVMFDAMAFIAHTVSYPR